MEKENLVHESYEEYKVGNKISASYITGDTDHSNSKLECGAGLRLKFTLPSKRLSRRNSDGKLLIPVKTIFDNAVLNRRYINREGIIYICVQWIPGEKNGIHMKNFKTKRIRKLDLKTISEWDQFYEMPLSHKKEDLIFESYLDVYSDDFGNISDCSKETRVNALEDLASRAGYKKGDRVDLKKSLPYDSIYFAGDKHTKKLWIMKVLDMALFRHNYEDSQGRKYKSIWYQGDMGEELCLRNLNDGKEKTCNVRKILKWDQIYAKRNDLEY